MNFLSHTTATLSGGTLHPLALWTLHTESNTSYSSKPFRTQEEARGIEKNGSHPCLISLACGEDQAIWRALGPMRGTREIAATIIPESSCMVATSRSLKA